MSYPQFSGYQLGSIVQDIADLETNLGGAITNLQSDVAGVVADVDSVKTEVLSIPKSPIISVQRGVADFSSSKSEVVINVSSHNVAKSMIVVNGGAVKSDAVSSSVPFVSSHTATQIKFSHPWGVQTFNSLNNSFEWQLVVFS